MAKTKAAAPRVRVTRQLLEKTRQSMGKVGDEGNTWGEISERNDVRLIRALNWYAASSIRTETYEKWLLSYMSKNDYSKAQIRWVKNTVGISKDIAGKYARMVDLGAVFVGECEGLLTERINRLLENMPTDSTTVADVAVTTAQPMAEVINIQDRIKASAAAHIVVIDDEISSWYEQRKKKIEFSWYNYLQKHQPSAPVCKHIRKAVEDRYAEHAEMMTFKDEQLNEAYEYLPLSSKREILRMLKVVLDDIDRFVGNIKATKVRKPRAKKPVSVEKQVGKLKYLPEYAKLRIKSVSPESIVNACQVWIYNTKTNQIYQIEGIMGAGTLAVKGTAIVGYDEGMSVKKKVRKPEAIIKQVLDGNKSTLKKLMTGIKSKAQPFNGRINADCVILRCVK